MEASQNVNAVLHCSCCDLNYRQAIPRLTDAELLYCIANEDRKTGLTLLQREARKRGLEVP